MVRVPGGGSPSSLTVPFSVTVLVGSSIVWFGPALTTGACFTGNTITVTCKTYAPASSKLAVVTAFVASPNVTLPGPLALLQVDVSVLLGGSPSSVTEPFRLVVTDTGMGVPEIGTARSDRASKKPLLSLPVLRVAIKRI